MNLKVLPRKESRHKEVHAVWFYTCKILENKIEAVVTEGRCGVRKFLRSDADSQFAGVTECSCIYEMDLHT